MEDLGGILGEWREHIMRCPHHIRLQMNMEVMMRSRILTRWGREGCVTTVGSQATLPEIVGPKGKERGKETEEKEDHITEVKEEVKEVKEGKEAKVNHLLEGKEDHLLGEKEVKEEKVPGITILRDSGTKGCAGIATRWAINLRSARLQGLI